ncbi:MAG: hypothetical protein U9Q05_14125 [Thermodesulfobacteriota bacterium]|nr:hypothetical protein [Thermodesulfobacteriota bacterium]
MKNKSKLFILCAVIGAGIVSVSLWYFFGQTSLLSSEAGTPREQLIERIPTAILLWSEEGIVTGSSLKHWKPMPIAKGENPRWSPDGSQFVFTRENNVWLMQNDLTDPVKIIKGVVTDSGTGAYWTETGDGIVAIRNKNTRQVVQLDLASAKTKVIHDEGKPPFKGYRLTQCAEVRQKGRYLLTFTRDEGHQSMIIDLKGKRYITNELMRKGDCGPAWSPDGKFIVMTRRVRVSMNRPIFIARFDSRTGELSASRYFVGKKRCEDASISNDSLHVLYVSSGNIFVWRVGGHTTGKQDGIQLTHTGKGNGPNLHIFTRKAPKAFR